MKLCIDCKWYRKYVGDVRYSKCAHPSLLSPVAGQAAAFCKLEREGSGACGPQAKLFEEKPKEPETPTPEPKAKWWQFWRRP